VALAIVLLIKKGITISPPSLPFIVNNGYYGNAKIDFFLGEIFQIK